MAKTKKKEIQKQGLRPSQKAKAEKLRQKQEAKIKAEQEPTFVQESISETSNVQTVVQNSQATDNTNSTDDVSAVKVINVKNAEGDPDTVAEILIQNNIDYTPKVSVVMPVYNVEPYLRQCLDSVINQTLKEIEIICVDDGSTDASLDILKEYAAKDNRITVITQKNLYAGVARNAGLSQAKGEYLSFLDSDDFFELDMLEETYAKINKEKTDVIMFNVFLFDDTLQEDKEVEWTLDIKDVPVIFKYNDVPEKIFKLSNCWVWNRLYKTEFVKENNIRFQKLGCANDTYFSCIATALASSITYLDKRYVHYRMNRQQFQNVTSFSFRHRFPTDLLNCFHSIYLKLKQLGIYETVKKSYLQVAVEHIIWSEKAFSDNASLHLIFVKYLSENYKEILQGKPPFNSNALNKKYTYLRNLLVDCGVFNEIPRRVYYVWGANEPKREEVLKCMRSWEQFLPDYDIVEINDESTKYFNFAHELETNSWFRTVYERKMWAYVADYIRMKALYENGGLYFDTDVSVVKNMDEFLTNKAFVGIQNSSLDGSGDWVEPAICGAQKGNAFIGKIVSFYDDLIWKKPIYTMPHLFDYFLRDYDIFPFPIKSKQKIIKLPDITLYPERYFIPYRFREEYRPECIEEDTHTIHWWGSSWVKPHIQYFLQNKHLLSNPKITVIICVYNVEPYLRQCLDSVINQTLRDIEIICVNDESPDNSLAILKEYAEKDDRIVIIDQKNQGLSGSRNNAMKIARGRYLLFLDSDDYIDTEAMEKLYNYANDNYLDFLSFSGYNFIDGKDELQENEYWNFNFLPEQFDCNCFNHSNCIDFICKMPVSSCLTMYRREFIQNNGFEFPVGLCYEDNVFYTKSLLKAQRCGILKDKLYYRRIHGAAITQNWNKHYRDYLEIIDILLSYIKNNNPNLYYPYKESYITRAKNIYNEFSDADKKTYFKPLKKLLAKYKDNTNVFQTDRSLWKACLGFVFYKLKLNSLCTRYVEDLLKSFRIDVKNVGTWSNNVRISADNIYVKQPKWFTDTSGMGRIIEGCGNKSIIKIKAVNNGLLKIDFRGQNRLYDDKRFPVWIDYKSIKIDGNEILSAPIATWHDKPYHYEMPVKDGQDITLEVEQQRHEYTENELRDVIRKVSYDNKYVIEHTEMIFNKLKKKFPIIDMETYRKRELAECITVLRGQLTPCRIDIKNVGNANNAVEVIERSNSVTTPKFLTDDKGIGKMMQNCEMFNKMGIKAANDGKLVLTFRGQNKLYNDKRIPVWVDYKSIKVDGKEILSAPIATWHDKPYNYEMPVKDGQEITLEVEQQYHEYSENELKDLLLKLNLNSEYIRDNVELIVSGLKNEFPIIDEETHKIRTIINNILENLSSFRLDIKNLGAETNDLKVVASNMSISEPKWAVDATGRGKLIQGHALKNTIELEAINDGNLRIYFRGQDKRFDEKRFPVWIDYKSIKIDGKEILSAPIATWHDKPYKYEMPVKDGQEITLEVEQQYHEYTENELKDLLLKMDPSSEYIRDNVELIVSELKNEFPIIDEETVEKEKLKKICLDIYSSLTTCRLDIKNIGCESNAVNIITKSMQISEPKWFANAQGIGKVLKGNTHHNLITLKIINDGLLRVDFQGQDVRYDNESIPLWIDYKSIKVNGKEILNVPIMTWLKEQYRYEMSVKDGQEIIIEFEQSCHEYTEDELRDILLKLYPSNEHIKENMDNLIGLLSKKIPIIDEKTRLESIKKHHHFEYIKKNILSENPVTVSLEEIRKNLNGRYIFKVNNVEYESVLLASTTKKLYVTLSAVGNNKGARYPIFHRVSFCNEFDGMYLCFDDPTRNIYNFAPAYYFGNPQQHYLIDILDIIKKIANINQIKYEDITFISSSNGGFASLWLCNELEGSRCFAYCPQIDIPLHRSSNFINGWNLDEVLRTRINLEHITKNAKSKFFIYSNIRYDDDRKQMELWFKYYNRELSLGVTDLSDNMKMLIVDIDGISPHNIQPGKLFTNFLINEYYENPDEEKLQAYIEELKCYALQELINNKDKDSAA